MGATVGPMLINEEIINLIHIIVINYFYEAL